MSQDPHQEREAARYANPIASREHILARMQHLGEPATFKRLAKELDITTEEQRQALKLRLAAMVRDGQLVVERSGRHAIAAKVGLIAGRVSAHRDGYGFVVCDEEREDVFLSHRQMRAVFHGDRVLISVRGKDRRGRDEGEIVEVLERKTQELVGRVYFQNSVALFEALNRRIDHEILISGDPSPLSPGQIVVARVVEQPSLHGIASVEVVEVLGEHLTPKMEVEIALRNHDIPFVFGDEALSAVDALPYEVPDAEVKRRIDLRHLDFVTIDGVDAKDFDDAVYCEARSGGWRLYVAIADVAHYVKVGTALDDEARQRGTSVYFPQYVVPMLPEKLSNGLCSLKPKEDRLAMVCEMTISGTGRVGSYQFYEATIHSKERLTYDQVGAWLAKRKFPRHRKSLEKLYALYRKLLERRESRGALDIDTSEVTFGFDDAGRVESVSEVRRGDAHRIIEECMLCANVCAARLIGKSKLPGLYRVHDRPEVEKVNYLRDFLQSIGCDLGGGDAPEPLDFQHAAKQLAAKPSAAVLQVALLRAMQQAVYSPDNRGHFGLGYREYAHFTSPIRRYPDLMVHRLIKALVHAPTPMKAVRREGKPRKGWKYPYEEPEVVTLGNDLSFAERRADDAVREVLDWVKCDFLTDHLGDEFRGIVISVTKFGVFVQLDEVFVEGMIHVSALGSDYYRYDQASQTLVGERTGRPIGIGDTMTVQVARVDVDERKVDLELLSHSPIRRKPPSKRKDRRSASKYGKRSTRQAGRGTRKRK